MEIEKESHILLFCFFTYKKTNNLVWLLFEEDNIIMDATMGLYVVSPIIGLVLFLLIRLYLKNKRLKKEISSLENQLEFVRGILKEYTKKYGEEISNEFIEDSISRAGITDETPLKVKMSKKEWEEYEKGINEK